jgi:hypothetical protein
LIADALRTNWKPSLRMLYHLAGRDPQRALIVLKEIPSNERWYACIGYLRGLPEGTDWAMLASGFDDFLREVLGEEVVRARFDPQEMHLILARRWLQSDLSGALQWYADAPDRTAEDIGLDGGASRGEEKDDEEARARRVSDLMSGGWFDSYRDEMLHWVQNQPWKWPYSDEIPRALLFNSWFLNSEIRPALLAAIRSEVNRYRVLLEHFEDKGLNITREAMMQMIEKQLAGAKLTAEHEAAVRDRLREARDPAQ